MKRIKLLLALTLFFAFTLASAQDKSNRPSPPAQVSKTVDDVTVTIDYSQPSVKGRKIFGELESYDKVWRAGANEATWIEFSEDVQINDQNLPKGKYAFFVIPKENQKWTLIFNKEFNQWGAYKYDQSKDALRVEVDTEDSELTEQLTYTIGDDGKVALKWAYVTVPFTVSKQ